MPDGRALSANQAQQRQCAKWHRPNCRVCVGLHEDLRRFLGQAPKNHFHAPPIDLRFDDQALHPNGDRRLAAMRCVAQHGTRGNRATTRVLHRDAGVSGFNIGG